MKKRLISSFSILLFCFFAKAQNGENIYQSFDLEKKIFPAKIIKLDVTRICTSVASRTSEYIEFEKNTIGFNDVKNFIAYSLFWSKLNESQNLSIEIRFSKNNLHWGQWQSVKIDEHNENKDRDVSSLLFIDKDIQWYQLRLHNSYILNNDLKKVTINFFNPNAKPALTSYFKNRKSSVPLTGLQKNYISTANLADEVNSTETTNACPCPLPSYITRNQWNCPQGQGLVSGVGTSTNVSHLIVHHSAGANTATDWNAVVLSIWNFHTGTNGYSDIGYNWLIAPNGQLYEGRGSNSLTQNVTGAHFCGTNANTMGVCMIGTYTSTDITAAARATLTKLLAWKCCQQNIPPVGTALHTSSGLTLNRISGHRDGCATDCPGTLFYGTIPALRTAVQQSIDTCGSTPPPSCVPSLTITNTGCPGNVITFSPNNVQNGGTAPTYSWYLNNVAVATGNTYVLNNAINGDKVYVRMTSNASCANPTQVNSDTTTLNCILTTALPVIEGLQYCRVTPNPNKGQFAVQMQLNNSTVVQYRLLTSQGQVLWQTNKERVQGVINKSITQTNLAAGTYNLEIYFDGKKLVKQVVVL